MKVEVKAKVRNEFETQVVNRILAGLEGQNIEIIRFRRQKTSFGADTPRVCARYFRTGDRMLDVNFAKGCWIKPEILSQEEADRLIELVLNYDASEFFAKCDKKYKINR